MLGVVRGGPGVLVPQPTLTTGWSGPAITRVALPSVCCCRPLSRRVRGRALWKTDAEARKGSFTAAVMRLGRASEQR